MNIPYFLRFQKRSSKKRGYTSCSSRISCFEAEGDWTFGAFPDLATLTQALATLQKNDSSNKRAAQATIKEIMERYGITDEEVTVQSKVEKKHRVKTRKKAMPSDEPRNELFGGF